MSAEEILKKHFDFTEGFTSYETECIVKAMEEYASQSTSVSTKANGEAEDVEALADMKLIKDRVLAEYEKGNVVFATVDGLMSAPLKEFVEQSADGILYDLNRNEAVVLTFIDDPKWVNDFAVAKVIQELKRQTQSTPKEAPQNNSGLRWVKASEPPKTTGHYYCKVLGKRTKNKCKEICFYDCDHKRWNTDSEVIEWLDESGKEAPQVAVECYVEDEPEHCLILCDATVNGWVFKAFLKKTTLYTTK